MPKLQKLGHGLAFGSTKMAPSTATSVSRMPRIKRAMRCVSFPTSTVQHSASQCITVHHSAAYRNSLQPFATCWLSFQTLSQQTKQQVSSTNAKNSAIERAKQLRTDVKALVHFVHNEHKATSMLADSLLQRTCKIGNLGARAKRAIASKAKIVTCVSLATISSNYSLFFFRNLQGLALSLFTCHKLGTRQDISSGHSCATLQRRYGWATQRGTLRH